MIDWKFSHVWNDSLLNFAERPMIPRDYIYASELGGPYIDRYLKMLGTKPTNPPNNRSLRKFQAGNIWEAVIGFVLVRAGILRKRQVRSEVELPGCLRVSGRIDFIAGGVMDWAKAEKELDQIDPVLELFPEFLKHAVREIIQKLKEEYTDTEFIEKVLEIKSVGSFVFERAKKTRVANENHILQNFHYLVGSAIDFGNVIYVSRDDCRLLEFPLYKTSTDVMLRYQQDIALMSDYYIHKELPPKEQLILFDHNACRFSKNWKIEYSYYLTKLYKFKTPKDYADVYGSMAASFNSTFKRCVDGKNMTDLNKQRIKEAKKLFPEWDDLVIKAREIGVLELVEDEDL